MIVLTFNYFPQIPSFSRCIDQFGPMSKWQGLGLGKSLALNPHKETHHRKFLKDSRHIRRLRFDIHDPHRLALGNWE